MRTPTPCPACGGPMRAYSRYAPAAGRRVLYLRCGGCGRRATVDETTKAAGDEVVIRRKVRPPAPAANP